MIGEYQFVKVNSRELRLCDSFANQLTKEDLVNPVTKRGESFQQYF